MSTEGDIKRILHGTSDEPSSNPWDTSPLSEDEAVHGLKVQHTLQAMAAALNSTRRSIPLQMLAEMQHVHPVFEAELPEIDGIRHGLFWYSISGTYQGQRVRRVLLGGQAMLISAAGRGEADRLAADGLQETITSALAYAMLDAESLQGNDGVTLESDVRPVH